MDRTPADILAELDELQQRHRNRRWLLTALPLLVILVAYVVLVHGAQTKARENAQLATAKAELEASLSKKKEERQSLEDQLQLAKLNRDSLSQEITEKSKQLENLKQSLLEVEAVVAKSRDAQMTKGIEKIVARPLYAKAGPAAAPLEAQARVRLALTPTKDSYRDRPVYQCRVWVDLPKERAQDVLKVEYFFDHPSFVPKLQEAFDAETGFALSYRGYGCVDATATLVASDGSRHPLPFDMCGLWKAAAKQ